MPTSEQVTRAAEITYRQLDHWVRRGYLEPAWVTNHTGRGRGTGREWTTTETAVACLMGRLTRAGLAPATAATVARSAQAGETRFVIAPGVVIELTGARQSAGPGGDTP